MSWMQCTSVVRCVCLSVCHGRNDKSGVVLDSGIGTWKWRFRAIACVNVFKAYVYVYGCITITKSSCGKEPVWDVYSKAAF